MATDNVLEEQSNQESTNDISQEIVSLEDFLHLDEIPVRIPKEFLFVYNKLLLLMVELGESMLLNCKSLCDTHNMPIVECYHIFKTALAAKQLASEISTEDDNNETTKNYYAKLSDTLLNYVKTQLNAIAANYANSISFTLPYDEQGLVNLFITINEDNAEIIVQNPNNIDIDELKKHFSIAKEVIKGFVVTDTSIASDYNLNEAQVNSHKYWHVQENNEFVPGTSILHLNGVRYILDDDDYEEWIIEEQGKQKGVGIILKTGYFDIGATADEIYIEAELIG